MEPPHRCGAIYNTGHYGPHDYRTQRDKLLKVEQFHFTPEMEAGIRSPNGTVAGEIHYTLKASPNHHRALVTMTNVVERARQDSLPGMEWPLECYFDRAIRFAHDDPVVRMLYARFLNQRNRKPEAEKQLMLASQFAPDNAFTQYNVGLVALEIGNHSLALKQAHMARAMGFTRLELENALRAANRWRDPSAESHEAAASAAGPVDPDARYTVKEPPPPAQR
jgi:tetratricopeptide (TPR) repeat protein